MTVKTDSIQSAALILERLAAEGVAKPLRSSLTELRSFLERVKAGAAPRFTPEFANRAAPRLGLAGDQIAVAASVVAFHEAADQLDRLDVATPDHRAAVELVAARLRYEVAPAAPVATAGGL